MNHSDHVDLLREGVPEGSGVWADLGCGAGAFTLALAELLAPSSVIYAVDRNRAALAQLEGRASSLPGNVHILTRAADFTGPLNLASLDGIVMANALHFYREKAPIIRSLCSLLKPQGRLILIEYNTDSGNPWVPYPIPYDEWEKLAGECGLLRVRKIGGRASSFLNEIYSAVGLRAE